MSNPICITPELLGVLASHDENLVKTVAAGSKTNAEVITVQNSSDEVHLALPFYADMNNKAGAVSDDEMQAVTGAMKLSYGIEMHSITANAIADDFLAGSIDEETYLRQTGQNDRAFIRNFHGAPNNLNEYAKSKGIPTEAK